MSLESDGGMILTGENRRTRRKTCPSATLTTTNPTWIDPGENPGLRRERRLTTWAMARLLPCVLIRLRKLSCEAAKVLIRTVVPHDYDNYTAVYPTLGLVTHFHEINIIRLSRLFPNPYMLLVLSSFVWPPRILWANVQPFKACMVFYPP
jgi:hypothetical protein